MCSFFSFVSNGEGKLYYFNWIQRQAIFNDELFSPWQSIENADSHSEICAFYDLHCDMVNKYEYNPLTKCFTDAQINCHEDDSVVCQKKVNKLNFKTIMKPLIVKKVVNPLKMKRQKIGLKKALGLLKKWALVWDSTGGPFVDHVGYGVYNTVHLSIADGIATYAMDTITDYCDTCGAGYSWQHVQFSVATFVRAYKISFLKIKLKYDLSPAIKLWNAGFFPSYNGNTWRLHGYNGKVLWKGCHG